MSFNFCKSTRKLSEIFEVDFREIEKVVLANYANVNNISLLSVSSGQYSTDSN